MTHHHLHEQRNLLDLHLLTQAWSAAHAVAIANPFEKYPTLEDDTTPEEVLDRLEQAVESTQLKTLTQLATSPTVLDELSWNAGRECARRRWPREEDAQITPLARYDRRLLLVALQNSPLSWSLGPEAFLIRRALLSEVSLELLSCPHQRMGSAKLCEQHFHWLRGYFHELHSAITLKIERTHSRCIVSW